MTQRRAELLTGYEIRRLETDHAREGYRYAAFEDGKIVAESWHILESLALRALVELLYRRNRQVVIERWGWRCARCGRLRPLQIHHRKFRSHGGTHRLENLEPVCIPCHDLIHRSERSK